MATIDPTPEQLHAHITGRPIQHSMSMYASSADYWKAVAQDNAKDANRYRWLRDSTDPDCEQPYVTIHKMNSWGKWFNTVEMDIGLDAAIDAAMAKEPKP